jgi:hypothetical protein
MLAVAATLLLSLSGCTSQVEVLAIEESSDLRGLLHYERQQFSWASVDAVLPPNTVRRLRNSGNSNVTLRMFRCSDPEDAYPASAHFDGDFFDPDNLPPSGSDPVRLTFHVPRHVLEAGKYGCAMLDARGFTLFFYKSDVLPLPPITRFTPVTRASSGRLQK